MIALALGAFIACVSLSMIIAWLYLFAVDVSLGKASGIGISYALIYVLIYLLYLISGSLIVTTNKLQKNRAIIVIGALITLITFRILFAFPIRTLIYIPAIGLSIDPNLISQILILISLLLYAYHKRRGVI